MIDETVVTTQLEALHAEGFRSIAVCLIHGYNFQGKSLKAKSSLLRGDEFLTICRT